MTIKGNYEMKGTINITDYFHWVSTVMPKDKENGIRLGQSFINYFNEHLTLPWTELFYEENAKKAIDIIDGNVQFI